LKRIVKNKYTCCKSRSGKLRRSNYPDAAGALWIPGQAQRLFYKLPWIYLLTYTSNQNEKIMRLLLLVSSLTYSVVLPIKPESKCFRVGSKYPKHIDCYCCQHPFCILMDVWTKWFAITERIKAIKKILMFLLTRFEEKNTWTVI
jgi:hypothetical protein